MLLDEARRYQRSVKGLQSHKAPLSQVLTNLAFRRHSTTSGGRVADMVGLLGASDASQLRGGWSIVAIIFIRLMLYVEQDVSVTFSQMISSSIVTYRHHRCDNY